MVTGISSPSFCGKTAMYQEMTEVLLQVKHYLHVIYLFVY